MEVKYKIIKDSLLQDIKLEKYQVGEKLPSCRYMAKEMDISYVTISKAINALAKEGFIELIHGKGAYVRWRNSGKFLNKKNVKIFIPSIENSNISIVKDTVSKLLIEKNWNFEIIPINSISELIEQIKNYSCYSIVFGFALSRNENISNLCTWGNERLIVINERYEPLGISSSTVDVSQTMRLCMQEMEKCNRKNIVLLCSNLKQYGEANKIATWQLMLKNNPAVISWQELLWNANLLPFADLDDLMLNFFEEKYQQGFFEKIDGVISTDDTKAVLFNSFCALKGIKIPDDISLIALNNSRLTKMVYPQISAIDIQLAKQVENAVAILEEKCSGVFNGVHLRLVEPELVVRDSLCVKE